MKPDPKILKAATVAALMNVLRADPYNLPVPKASQFPPNSSMREFWKLPITVTMSPEGDEYVASANSSWPIVPTIVIQSPSVLVGPPGPPVPAPSTVSRSTHQRKNQNRGDRHGRS